jgi:hypothetical protein
MSGNPTLTVKPPDPGQPPRVSVLKSNKGSSTFAESSSNNDDDRKSSTLEHSASQPRTWADMLDDEEREKLDVPKAVGYLERAHAAKMAASERTLILPIDLKTIAPRIYEWFEVAAKLTQTSILQSGSSVGTVMHAAAWGESQAAQTYLDGLDSDARRAERRLLISVIDFLQGMAWLMRLPVTEPSIGLFRSGCLFVEKYHEERYGTPRSMTAAALGRGELRNKLLEQMKVVFATPGVAANILNLAEIMSLKVFSKLCLKAGTEYANGVTEAVRPSVTQLALRQFRIVTVKEEVKGAAKGRASQVRTVQKAQPPSVPTSDKDIGNLATATEKILLRDIGHLLTDLRSKESLNICSTDTVISTAENIKGYIDRMYSLSDSIRSVLRTRESATRSRCVAKAKQLIEEKKALNMKAAFTSELWRQESIVVMEAEETDLFDTTKEVLDNEDIEDRQTLIRACRAWVEKGSVT